MIEFLQSFQLTPLQWLLTGLCGFLIGVSKTGIMGVSLAVVPLLAVVFGAKASTGVLLLILVFADIFAVAHYTKHTSWKHVLRLLPWALAGVGIAAVVGHLISGRFFTLLLALIILAGIVLIIIDYTRSSKKTPDYWWFSGIMGISGGFTTMIGNAAAPVMSLYLLSMRLPKKIFIGTAAWFFFIINLSKVPLHIFLWKTISLRTFFLDLLLLPAIILGAFSGVKIVKYIPETWFRILVIAMTMAAALLLLVK